MIELNVRFTSCDRFVTKFADRETDALEFVAPVNDRDRTEIREYLEKYTSLYMMDVDDRSAERTEAKLPLWGASLFESIFGSDDAKEVFNDFQDRDERDKVLTIAASHPLILSLPWELLSDPKGTYLSHGKNPISIRRSFSQSSDESEVKQDSAHQNIVPPKNRLRLLFVISRPIDAGFLDPRKDAIEDADPYLQIFHHYCELNEYESAFYTIRNSSNINDIDSFLTLRGYYAKQVEIYTRLVNRWQLEQTQQWKYIASLTSLGNAYYFLGQYQKAIAFYHQSLEIQLAISDKYGEAGSLMGWGNAYNFLGQYQKAIAFYHQSLEITQAIGYKKGEANSLGNLGSAYCSLAQYQQAISFLLQSLEIHRAIDDKEGEANSLINLGGAYLQVGRTKEGFAAFYRAMEILQELELPLEAMPYPKWLKSIIRFAQCGKWQIALCFCIGLFAFPLYLAYLAASTLWRFLRSLTKR
jgi:tetratricopeptide (TPR) repeat protein